MMFEWLVQNKYLIQSYTCILFWLIAINQCNYFKESEWLKMFIQVRKNNGHYESNVIRNNKIILSGIFLGTTNNKFDSYCKWLLSLSWWNAKSCKKLDWRIKAKTCFSVLSYYIWNDQISSKFNHILTLRLILQLNTKKIIGHS